MIVCLGMHKMAEGQGFEPWMGVNPCRFSRPVLSTAQPTLLTHPPRDGVDKAT